MGNRLGRLAGIFALALVLTRLGRLLQSGPDILQWRLILVAAVLLGSVLWWLIAQLPLSRQMMLTLFALGGLVLFLRVSVPATLLAGVIPSPDTLSVLAGEMTDAFRVIRHGIPPVLPADGLVAILAIVMWVIGALYSWGLSGGPGIAMTLPSIVVYLQFAVLDRGQAGLGWMTASTLMIALAVTATAIDRRSETGRARDAEGRAMPRRSGVTALAMASLVGVLAIVTTTNAAGLVSEYGNIPWRGDGTGFGGPGAGVAFDPFVDLRQSLISRSNTLLFQATLGPGSPPPNTLYWRLETLDEFNGVGWKRSNSRIVNYDPNNEVGSDYQHYQGTTVDVLQKIRVENLAQSLAPTVGVATEIHRITDPGAIDPQGFRVTEDLSLVYPPSLRKGDTYQLRAVYPDQDLDLGLLATGEDGNLSPIFQGAVDAGALQISPSSATTDVQEAPDLDFFTRLPENTPVAIRGIAVSRTQGATTDFERAWMLQHWFRDTGEFTYSTEVETGHDSLVLQDWLTDEESLNFRTGYCEQFAASMAVLGRELGIPSRVVIGFTPGTVTDNDVIQVRDTNAHAWVEMWMDCCGWVKFDPTPRGEFQPASVTAGFDPADYAPESAAGAASDNAIDPVTGPLDSTGVNDIPPAGAGQGPPRWWLLIVPAVALFAGFVPLAKRLRRQRRLRRARHGDITAVWDEIVDRLNDLGDSVPPSMTPMEFARGTDNSVLTVALGYSAVVYGGREGNATELDLLNVESWLGRRYDTGKRVRAAFSTRSLLER